MRWKQRDGHVSAFEQQMRDSRDAAPTITSCAFCSWRYVGLTGEGRKRSATHRREAHPDKPASIHIQGKKRVVRLKWKNVDATGQ